MSRTLFSDTKLAGSEETSIVVDGGKIAAAGASADVAFDCTGLTLLPGFIDVHIHGAMGIDVNVADVDGLLEIGKFLARNGVTAWVPTFSPSLPSSPTTITTSVPASL